MKISYIEGRSDAKKAGRTTYYTGKSCINGHTAYRYVASGACSECINGSNRQSRGNTSARFEHEQDDERAKALRSLIQVAVCVQAQDVPEARDMAAALCLARFPCLTVADVTLNKPPQKWAANVPKNHFLIPSVDLEVMRAIENNLLAKYKVDFSAVRKRMADLVAVANLGDPADNDYKNT